MKTIVDSCVWSLAFRRRKTGLLNQAEQELVTQLTQLIQNDRVVIVGPIRQEVLSGVRDRGQFTKLQGLLDPFRDEEILPADYIEAARFFNLCRSKGAECGATDILLCAVASRLNCKLLTNDVGLLRCIAVLRSEGLTL